MRSVGVQVGCQVKNGSTQTSQRSSKLAATQTPRTSTAPAAVQCRPQQRNQAVAVCPDTRDQAAEAIIKVKSTAVGEDAMLSDESDEENDTEHIDPSWEPTSSSSSSSLPPPRNQAKFIVFEDNLKQLLKHCYLCGGKVHHFQLHENGSQLRVAFTCQNNCHAQWVSQPKEGGIAAGNLLVSTAIVVTGLTYQRLAEFSCGFRRAHHFTASRHRTYSPQSTRFTPLRRKPSSRPLEKMPSIFLVMDGAIHPVFLPSMERTQLWR